ncbi:hypothetical protein DL764_005492 [Monosporascus ibericus]|uniref:Major facilitator superfamily (MFS) profile domain-containing protein n=1 Tax=Monosporascus ibericus TaxID=155417 RepID=A0A4Q4T8X9_9PEZI|nr:hypothetical protein DL764_005492 [Monosporascus ibericus]
MHLPPFPRRQMLVLAFMGIFPYIYFMIEDFHITEDKSKISFYAGMVTSAFTFAEFVTGLFWGRLSDKIGRKPVLLMGLIGTALSVLIFGFAPNLTVALIARAVGGLLNGNMGVLQTTVAELVTVKEHQPRAYTIMPVVWCLGAVIVLIGVVNGILFLEETHAEKKSRRDCGLELGNWILSCIPCLPKCTDIRDEKSKLAEMAETQPLMDHDEQLPGYRTNENSPQNSPLLKSTPATRIPRDSLYLEVICDSDDSRDSRIFTRPVILNIISFGILAFHTMTFDQLFPVFLSTETPEPRVPMSLPFKFVDGFGLDSKTVGIILSVQGAYSLVINMVVVPAVLKRLGALRLFRFLIVAYFALYLITPYLVLLPESYRMAGVGLVLVWKCTFANMAYPSNAILTTDSAPSRLALGTINGVAASTASLCRAFGPTISGILYTVGLKSGYSGLAWWCSAIVAVFGAIVGLQIREPRGHLTNAVVDDDVEAGQLQ